MLGLMSSQDTPAPMLEGHLRQQQIPPFLEFLLSSNHTGTLELEGPNEQTGEICVKAGRVLFASCETPEGFMRGMNALRAVLRWPFAYFTVTEHLPENFPANISGSITHLLLDASRLEDESSLTKLPEHAALRVRSNLQAYADLGPLAVRVYQKAGRAGSTVQSVRAAFPEVNITPTLIELYSSNLLDIEEFNPLKQTESENALAFMEHITPVRVTRNAPTLQETSIKALNHLHETVFALVDGTRTGEEIRLELRIAPGKLREALQNLRAVGRVDYA
jgi:Domain of unknown function (DUF4388)